MFSPNMISEVQQNRYCAGVEKKHALLDKILLELEQNQTPSRSVSSSEPSPCIRMAAPRESHKMLFSDFMKNGWDQEKTLNFSLCAKLERMRVIENIKRQFQDFIFLLDCGRGSFGHVWLVQDMTGMVVALKVIPKELREHLEKELDSLRLYRQNIKNFKNLVQIYHVGQTRDFFYYTMEAAYSLSKDQYIPLTLNNMFEFCNFLPMDTPDIASSLLGGVSELHTYSLSHRDIKPDNIIFVNGIVKLCDMGLVSENRLKEAGGTNGFIPPDLLQLENTEFGVACDLYAMGKVLYMMLANSTFLFDFPKLSKPILNDSLGKRLNKVVNTACAEKQEKRFHSAHEFILAVTEAKAPPKGFFSKLFS